jgi:pimeloyl-ACP methyl ester carboxylesterase
VAADGPSVACVAAAYREAGAGVPVVCIHASASSSGQWRPLMERLAGRFHSLAVDLYGYGQSPPWPGERRLSLADEVQLLEPILESTGDRFHLIGHSYGGAVALKAALVHSSRLRSLVLFEPVLFRLLAEDPRQPAAREIVAVRDDTVAAVDRGDFDAAGARFVDYWMGTGAWATMPPARRQTVASVMPKVKAEWHAAFTEPTPLSAFAVLDVPTLCIVGSTSPASSRGVARLLAATLPSVTTLEIDGVGHMAPVTHPDRVNAVIERYLETGRLGEESVPGREAYCLYVERPGKSGDEADAPAPPAAQAASLSAVERSGPRPARSASRLHGPGPAAEKKSQPNA